MSTANLPTVSCLLDDGSGTFPIDISAYVNLSAGISWGNYGRADWDTQPTPATLEITIGNDSGAFTTGGGGGGFGVGPFGVGPFGGSLIPISKGQRIRFGLTLGATVRTCFTGRIDSLTQTFTGPAGKRSGITVLAVDVLQELARRPLRSMLEHEILVDTPYAYYTLTEPEGSTTAGDTSGNGRPTMGVDTGDGYKAPTFGAGAGPVDGLTAPTFAAGQVMVTRTIPAVAGGTFECVVSATAAPATDQGVVSTSNGSLGITSTGRAFFAGSAGPNLAVSTATITDGLPHHLVGTFDGTYLRLYVDGVLVGTPDNTDTVPASTYLYVGGRSFTGTISHVALYSTPLSAGRIAAHAGMALGTLSETTDARLSRLASYVGLTATTVTPSGQLMPPQATSGVAALDALQAVATAENGVLFANGTGSLTMQGRQYRGQRLTADVTLPGKALDPASTGIVDDTSQTINFVTVARSAGATQLYPTPAPTSNVFPSSIDITVDSDANALAHAQWVVNKHSSPPARMGSASTSNMLTSTSASALLAMEIGNRVALTSMPSTTTPNLGTALSVEGWSMSLSIDGSGGSWVWTLNLVPWSFYQCAIWGDPGSTWGGSAPWAL